jgi:cupin fold WbuC family metalloprotein
MRAVNLRVESEEVLYTQDAVTKIDKDDIDSLKSRALGNVRERARLCTHLSVDDAVHEMLIVHTSGTYIRPHKHSDRSESFHIVEGRLDIVMFDDQGGAQELIELGEYSSGYPFFWRINESRYHTVIPRTAIVVFHETTGGPFVRATSFVPAPWSPEEGDAPAVARYQKDLENMIPRTTPTA